MSEARDDASEARGDTREGGGASVPAAIVRGGARPRRHRLVTAPAALVLFACMFLPTSSSCGHVARPLTDPASCWPYVLAAAAAAAALSRGGPKELHVAGLTMALGVVDGVYLAAGLVLADPLIGGALGLVASFWLTVGGGLWIVELERERGERAPASDAARAAIVALALVALASYAAIAAWAPFDLTRGSPGHAAAGSSVGAAREATG